MKMRIASDFRVIFFQLIYAGLITTLFLSLPYSKDNKNILHNKNIWRSKQWILIQNPFDNKKALVSRYGGSEVRFRLENSKQISIRASSSNHAFDQGISVDIDGTRYQVETPEIDKKTLDIKLPVHKGAHQYEVIIRHHCAGSTHPCDLWLKEIAVDISAKIYPPVSHPEQTIAFLGDSISVGFSENNYTYLVAERMGMLLHNASVFGSRIGRKEGWDSVQDRLQKDVINYQPDILVVALGTNDLYDNISELAFRELYAKLIRDIRSGTPDTQIITLALFNRRDISEFRIRQFNYIINSIASENGITHVDPFHWLSHADLMDGVHPSLKSQEKIAEHMYRAIVHLRED